MHNNNHLTDIVGRTVTDKESTYMEILFFFGKVGVIYGIEFFTLNE